MTAISVRAMVIALSAAGLAGCIDARSQYAPYAGYTPPPPNEPMRPQYPVSEDEARTRAEPAAPVQQPPVAPLSDDPDGPGPKSAPAAGVGSQSLPPVSDAPAQRTPAVYYSGHALRLTPLVWRSDAEPVERDEVAHHHHRARPEADATPRRRHHARGDVKPATNSSHTVVMRKGDTIDSIADQLGTTPEAIIKANHLRHPRDLDVGRKLKVPASKTYVVKSGDTLYAIGRRFDVPVDALKNLNGLEPRAKLQPGQSIDLPGHEAEVASEAPPAPPEKTKSARGHHRSQPPRRAEFAETDFGSSSAAPARGAPIQDASAPAAAVPTSVSAAAPDQPIPYGMMPGHVAAPATQSTNAPPAQTYPAAPSTQSAAATPSPTAPPMTSLAPPQTQPYTEIPASPSDAQVAAAGRGRFNWPVRGGVVSGYGPKGGGQRNDGLDISAPDGTSVVAAASGDVVYAGNLVPGFGNLVLIKHEDGWVTAYAHLSRTEVKIKDHVAQGAEIGTVGSSGGVGQPQLHFEVRYASSPRERARPIDPTLVLPAAP